MKIKGWQIAGALALLLLAVFNVEAFAEEASEAAGDDDKLTMFGLIQKGGYLMLPLGLASLLALALGLERFIALGRQRVLPAGFMEELTVAWNEDSSGEQAVEFGYHVMASSI